MRLGELLVRFWGQVKLKLGLEVGSWEVDKGLVRLVGVGEAGVRGSGWGRSWFGVGSVWGWVGLGSGRVGSGLVKAPRQPPVPLATKWPRALRQRSTRQTAKPYQYAANTNTRPTREHWLRASARRHLPCKLSVVTLLYQHQSFSMGRPCHM